MFNLDMIEDKHLTFVEAVLLSKEQELAVMTDDDLFEAIQLSSDSLDASFF